MRRRGASFPAAAFGLAVAAACSVPDYSGFDGADAGGPLDVTPDRGTATDASTGDGTIEGAPDAARESSGTDATFDAAQMDSAATDAGPCHDDAGPNGVNVGSGYCVDGTEVTNAEYDAFLLAVDGGTGNQPTECAWNTTLSPAQPIPAGRPNHPVANVNWCDAFAYCAWAGKRLCGKIGGGPVPLNANNNGSSDQWFQACSRAGAQLYPYNLGYQPTYCNGADLDAGGTLGVRSLMTCVGAYAGLFDMSGNVAEWEDSCHATDAGPEAGPADDACEVRGGAFSSSAGGLRCDSNVGHARKYTSSGVGFRCCAP